MNVQRELIHVLRDVIGALAAQQPVDWPNVLNVLEKTRDAALEEIDTDEGLVTCVVSTANLLLDCARGVVQPSTLGYALQRLDAGPRWNDALTPHYRQGTIVELTDEMANGFSAVRWQVFSRHLASLMGFSRDQVELEKLWERLKGENVFVPAAEVQLMHPSRTDSAWVTDDEEDGYTLVTADVYDALGLNWSFDLSDSGSAPGEARAVLLCCPLHVRKRAARTLHCPNAVDGWGNLFFVPRVPTGEPWPHHGSYTARPESDDASLPEAVHGHLKASNTEVSLRGIEYIRVGNRVVEHGLAATQRAIDRLRATVME